MWRSFDMNTPVGAHKYWVLFWWMFLAMLQSIAIGLLSESHIGFWLSIIPSLFLWVCIMVLLQSDDTSREEQALTKEYGAKQDIR